MKPGFFFLVALLFPGVASAASLAPEVGVSWEFLSYLGVLFAAGVGTSLTPCVYPLIGVTVGIFGAKKAKGRLRAFLLSMTYVLGMQVTFIAMGVLSALAGKALGSLLANPFVNLFLAAVFVAFALSYFGLYEIDLPQSLKTRFSQIGGQGYAPAFGMGLVGGIIAAPCTGPALGALATSVGTSQNILLGVLGFSAFGFGLGLLFLLVGTFSSLALPKSGPWMDAVKSFLGIVILVLALYYAQNAITLLHIGSDASWVLWTGAGLVVLGLALGAIHLSVYGASLGQKFRKALGVLLTVAGAHMLVGWISYVPKSLIFYQGGVDEAFALARAEEKPVFIDFGAEWCSACKELEANVFSHPEVIKESSRFVAVQVDCTRAGEGECGEMEKRYQVPGLPLVLFFDSNGNLREDVTVQGELSPQEFLERMRAVQ